MLKIITSLKPRKSCGIDGVPNKCLRHLPIRPLVHLTHLINHYVRLSNFPTPFKEANMIALPKPGKDPKFPQYLRPISLLSTTGKLFEEVILKVVQRHIENGEVAKCESVWLPCTSQHDSSMYKASGPRDPSLQE
jgi:hypothetical protein